nr:LysM domain-containing protein [Kineobactrum salinum]
MTRGWVLLGGVLLAACAVGPVQGPPEPVATVGERRAVEAVAQPGLTPQARFREALRMLEDGRARQARAELVAYLQEKPRSDVARDLLRQLDEDSNVYYPASYREITLASGESLSTLAHRYLGSVYQFYALAKYNGIAEPRRLRAGQILKIPLTETARASFAVEDDPESLAREMAQEAEAAALTTDAALPQEAAAEAETKVEAEADTGAAVAGANPAGEETEEESLPEPALQPAAVAAVPAGEPRELHRRALNAYRAQDLDKAIDLWNRVLVLDPEHENARLYRAQALELQSKLRRLN